MQPGKQNIQEKSIHGAVGTCCLLLCYGIYAQWSFTTLITILQTGIIIVLSLYLVFIKKNDSSKLKKSPSDAANTLALNSTEVQQKQPPTFAGPDTLIQNYETLKTRLLELSDNDDEWALILERRRGEYYCKVEKRVGGDFFFRVTCDFESTPEEAFDYL